MFTDLYQLLIGVYQLFIGVYRSLPAAYRCLPAVYRCVQVDREEKLSCALSLPVYLYLLYFTTVPVESGAAGWLVGLFRL